MNLPSEITHIYSFSTLKPNNFQMNAAVMKTSFNSLTKCSSLDNESLKTCIVSGLIELEQIKLVNSSLALRVSFFSCIHVDSLRIGDEVRFNQSRHWYTSKFQQRGFSKIEERVTN